METSYLTILGLQAENERFWDNRKESMVPWSHFGGQASLCPRVELQRGQPSHTQEGTCTAHWLRLALVSSQPFQDFKLMNVTGVNVLDKTKLSWK